VVLVTHFMDEAERLCDRLAVVDRGRIVALGSPQDLIEQHGGGLVVRFTAKLEDLSFLAAVRGVERVRRRNQAIEVEGSGPVLARVAAALVDRGIEPSDLRVERSTLEDIFLRLTDGPRTQ
jgi:ABC-2 type transport system ATP-binding protein